MFSEYHCNLYFPEVKQISGGGSIPLLWDGCSPSDSATPPAAPSAADTLTIHPLASPAHKSLPPWEPEQSLSRPAPLPPLGESRACVAATP